MAGKKKIPVEAHEQIQKLNEAGMSYAALAAEYNVDARTISRICKPEKYNKEKERMRQYYKGSSTSIINTRKENQRVFRLVLSRSKDGDIISFLESKENINDYLRTLIRSDMEQTNKSE